jgi:hypothetical protein
MALSKSLVDEAWDALFSNRCQCGKPKGTKKSFCYDCYKSLPQNLQRDLYKPFSEGYAEVFDEARSWLKENAKAGGLNAL